MKLVETVYRLTSTFPREELFGLAAQMRRAAVSVPSNIAEGAARSGSKELLRFLHIANGSLAELDTQMEICSRLGFVEISQIEDQLERVHKLMSALTQSIRNKL